MYRLPYFQGPLRRKCIGHKRSLCFPNISSSLKTVAHVSEDVPHNLNVRGCVLSYYNACMPPAAFEC